MTTPEYLPPGSTVGILGGGQLGRMLAMAAARLGMKTHIYCPDPLSPAFDVTPLSTVAAYEDEEALAAFAAAVDVVTYEFENVPAATARFLAERVPLRPGADALAITQDRLAEKQFLTEEALPVTPYRPVSTVADLEAGLAALGRPAVLKTTRLGYDGRGQRVIGPGDDPAAAFDALAPHPLVLEAFAPFEREISIIAARGLAGDVACYDPSENTHRHHILATSSVPADIWPVTAATARRIAERILLGLDYLGVLGVEFFAMPQGKLLVNEIAPRVHNSGHWTEVACTCDQFEQHIRAVCGWPLGDTARHADVVMRNLIGDDVADLPAALGPGERLHLYGKAEARPGRKMGHVNRLKPHAPAGGPRITPRLVSDPSLPPGGRN